MIVVKAFIKTDVAETVAYLGNGCTGQSCSVRLPLNVRRCNQGWAIKMWMSYTL